MSVRPYHGMITVLAAAAGFWIVYSWYQKKRVGASPAAATNACMGGNNFGLSNPNSNCYTCGGTLCE